MTEHRHGFTRSFAAVAFVLLTAQAQATQADLSKQILAQDGWVSYQVPMTADAGFPCCYEMHANVIAHVGCDLDGRSWSTGTVDRVPPQHDGTLAVYLHVQNAAVDKARAFAAACPVRDAERIRRIEPVNAADSVAWLAQIVARDDRFNDATESELAALAMHADASATAALRRLSEPLHPRKLREQALFWSGQLRGADGARLVEQVATGDTDADLRAHAVFVLSQVKGMDGYASIHRIAQNDASDHVREQALFWMAQTGDARAKNDILAALTSEKSEHVRDQAVFALSQLKDHEADAALIGVVRGEYPHKVKEQALFWLGQSGSDKAIEFLDDVLTKKKASAHDT